MLRRAGGRFILDWIFQFNAEPIDLRLFQSRFPRGIQKYIGMCLSQLLEQKNTVQCLLCLKNDE